MIAFGPDNENSFHTLYERVSSLSLIKENKDSTTKFFQLLANFKSSFQFKFPEKSSDARNKIQTNNVDIKGVPSALPDSLKELVLQVSDALNLNELVTLSLIFTATKSNPPQVYGVHEYQLSIKLFYEDYLKLLSSVLILFQSRFDDNLHPNTRDVVVKFTNELLSDNIISAICSQITSLSKQINEAQNLITTLEQQGNQDSIKVYQSSEQIKYKVEIRRGFAECLFFACSNTQCDEDSFFKIFNTFTALQNLFNQCVANRIGERQEEFSYSFPAIFEYLPVGTKSIFSILYLLTTTIISLLDPTIGKIRIDPKASQQNVQNTLYKNPFIEKFDKLLDNLMPDDHDDLSYLIDRTQFEAMIALQWCVGLRVSQSYGSKINADVLTRSDNAFSKSLSRGVFIFITTGLLNNKVYRSENENIKEFIVYILGDLISSFILNLEDSINDSLADQIEELRSYLTRRDDNQASEEDEQNIPKDFNDILLLLGELYRDFSGYAHKYFDRDANPKLSDFLRKTCCEQITSLCKFQVEHDVTFIYYLGVLCSFSGDSVGATNVFALLNDSTYPLFCWEYFFKTLLGGFRAQCYSNEEFVFEQRTLDAISVVLKLVEVVCRHSEESRTAFLENSNWNVLGLLFEMMFAPKITPCLMGQVFFTLSAFLKPSQGEPSREAIAIISQMSRILHYEVRDQKYEVSSKGGIKYQLNFREAQEGEYYETLGFLELIDALISSTGIPLVGFTPFLKFIQEDVFNNFSKRFYKEPSDKWLIAKSCLQIFTKLLSRYTPSTSDFEIKSSDDETPKVNDSPAGFQLMRDMLSDTNFRKELFKIIIGKDFNLEEERYNNREGEALEKSVIYALEIIENTLLKEDDFIKCSTSKVNLTPLVIKRLAYQLPNPLIIKLIDLIDYSHNNEIRYRVVNILCMVSKNASKLVSLFKDEHKEKTVVKLFVKYLHAVTTETNRECSDIEENVSVTEEQRDNETRLRMLDLLKANLDAPGENLSHLLCGFDVSNDEPREIDIFNEKTCLTVILNLLKSKQLPITHPRFIESCYELIYKLCADRRVSQQTFACLEKANFLIDKLKNANFSTKIEPSPLSHHILNQRGFVIRIVALKLYSNTKAFKKGDSNRGGVQELVHILFGGDSLSDFSRSYDSLEQRRALMLEILDTIDLNLAQTVPSQNLSQDSKEWKLFLKNWSSTSNSFDGWKQVVEITLSQCFGMIPDDGMRLRILHDIISSLLFKLFQMKRINKGKQQQKLELLVSQVILRVMSKLREEFITGGEVIMLPADQCLTIFRNLLECILLSEQNEQSIRGNLYSTLINYLQYTKRNELNYGNDKTMNLQKNTELIIDKYDLRLFTLVAKDALDAKNIWKAVSYSLLETFFTYTTNIAQRGKWITYFESSGCLKQILDSVTTEAKNNLPKVLQPTLHETDASSLNRLFIYENAMSFLLKFTDVDVKSAETMMGFEVITKICSHFIFIDLRPSIVSHQYGRKMDMEDDMEADWEPSITEKYNQLVIPAIKLIVAIQSNMRGNKKVAEQVLSFVEQHRKSISAILKMENIQKNLINVDSGSLELVRLVTEMMYLLSLHQDVMSSKLHTNKYEKLMLNALVKLNTIQQLGSTKKTINILDANMADEYGIRTGELQFEYSLEQKRCCIDEICKTIINFCRVVSQYPEFLTSGSSLELIGKVLFTHFISGPNSASGKQMALDEDIIPKPFELDQRPSLHVLGLLLQNGYHRLNNALEERFTCESNLQQLDQLKIEQLNNIVRSANTILGEEHFLSFFEKQDSVPNEAKLLCRTILSRKLLKLDSHLNTHITLLENTLIVLLRHISFYVQNKESPLSSEQRAQLLQEATTGSLNKLLDEILQMQIPKSLLQGYSSVDNIFHLTIAQRLKNLIFQVNTE